MSDELFKLARTTMSVTVYEGKQEAAESVKLSSVQHIKGQMKERSEGFMHEMNTSRRHKGEDANTGSRRARGPNRSGVDNAQSPQTPVSG